MGATAVAATLSGAALPLALALALIGLFPSAVTLGIEVVARRQKAKVDVWWETLRSGVKGDTPGDVREEIEDRIEEPHVHETVVESVRQVLDAHDPSVVPVIGKLSAEYYRAQRSPDGFFRGFSRMLADLSGEELRDFRRLMQALAKIDNDGVRSLGALEVRRYSLEGGLQLRVAPGAFIQYIEWIDHPSSFRRLCHLLKMHELADEMLRHSYKEQPNPLLGFWIETPMLERIVRLLGN